MVDRLISHFIVRIKRSGYVAYKDKQHHGISAHMLVGKLGIGLDNSKCTLQSTTQYNVRLVLKPLTQRYRKYFLSQRLCLINCRFYIDTLSAKENSIVGNTFGYIFTDGDFL